MHIDGKIMVIGLNLPINPDKKTLNSINCGKIAFTDMMSDALRKMFDEVIAFDVSNNFIELGMIKTNEKLIDIAEKSNADYALIMMAEMHILPETIDVLRSTGIKTIGYFFDDLTLFEKFSAYQIGHFDYIVTIDTIYSKGKYEELGVRAVHWPVGVADDKFHKTNEKYKYEVSFVGLRTTDRERQIDELKKRFNIDISVFGHGWNDRGDISIQEMNSVFNSSKINLNFTKSSNGKTHLKGRIFEATVSGGFLLTEYADGIENYFEEDKEIVCFRTIDELNDKIKYYLAHDVQREEILHRGWKKAIQNHTWEKHFERVFDMILNSESNQCDIKVPQMTKAARHYMETKYMHYALGFFMDGMDKIYSTEIFKVAKEKNAFGFRIWVAEKVIMIMPYKFAHIIFLSVNRVIRMMRDIKFKSRIRLKKI